MQNSNPSPAWTELNNFVRQTLGLPEKIILTPQTTLGDDLRMDGDDGDEFVAAFGQRLDIALGDFEETRHFRQEDFFLKFR